MPVLLSTNIYTRLTVRFYISVSKDYKESTAANVSQNTKQYRAKWVVEEHLQELAMTSQGELASKGEID